MTPATPLLGVEQRRHLAPQGGRGLEARARARQGHPRPVLAQGTQVVRDVARRMEQAHRVMKQVRVGAGPRLAAQIEREHGDVGLDDVMVGQVPGHLGPVEHLLAVAVAGAQPVVSGEHMRPVLGAIPVQ